MFSTTRLAEMLDPHIISFPKFGFEISIDPTAFTIFGLEIQWYGIIITLGLILAIIYCFPKMKRFGIDSDRAVDVVIGGVLGGIVGARLYYVAMKWDQYKGDSFGETFKAVINTRNGGLAIYGGIIGAFIVGFIICKIRKVKPLPMLDVTVIGFLIGQGVGRWGNFVNQEAFGTNTDFFLGMTGGTIQRTINNGMQIGGDMYTSNLIMDYEKPVHPCFLYESLWCILGFVVLAFLSKRRKYDGQIFLMYLTWYGLERFLVEGLRTDSLMIGNIRISQALSLVILAVSVIIQIVMFFRVRRDPESFVLYASTEESRLMIEESRRKRMGIKGADARIMDDDSDEIGILPDENELAAADYEDDDDEIGILPDEDEEDDVEDTAEEEAEEVTETSDDTTVEDTDEAEDTAEEAEEADDTVEEADEADDDSTEEADEANGDTAEEADEAADDEPEEESEPYEEYAEEYDRDPKDSHNKNKKHYRK